MEDIYKLLAENMVFPMWIKDTNLRFIFANKSYADLTDKKVEDIIGYTNEEIYEPEISKVLTKCSAAVLESGEIKIEELYIDKGYKKGIVIPLKNKEKEIIAIYGIITDVGEIKEKEKEIEFQKNITRQIMDILPGMVFCKDKNSKYIYANKEYRDFYQKRGFDNIIGKNDYELNIDKKQIEEFLEDDKRVVLSKETICREIVLDEEDKENVKEVVKMSLLDINGNVKGIIGRALDISESKRIQSRLEYLSYTDILTGTKNRTFFEECEREFNNKENFPLGVIMGDVNGLKLVNDTLGHNEGDKLLKAVAKVLREVCGESGKVFRFGGDEFIITIKNTSLKYCEELEYKIYERCKEHNNDLFNISIALGTAVKYNNKKDIYQVVKEAEDKVYRKKLLQNRSIKSSVLNSLKIGLGIRSVETEQHTERVMINAIRVGEKLGLERSVIDELTIAAELHDIGKIGVSERILLKPGALTEEEYEIMKTHSEKGYRIVMASSELKNIAESVLYHHERWDGKGYPIGLKGEEIPLLARIINVCDSYDVMTNIRVYNKKAKSKEDAIKELKRCSGTQFDPKIVDIFISILLE
ncbi:sensor domain-containing diguanylate cyclase/phosphohydrolase [Clostridium massiliamazoniense]|uniref:sensor domain-containing diguanylate cyclase/phosphohydrolase n=1 Tax=Clostridium massiliamazoniense TaxID=1347366 RepID=UPI0006D7A521|nr:HD domain-containing phosphohydrolase [Clostridium massiliamazoniense]